MIFFSLGGGDEGNVVFYHSVLFWRMLFLELVPFFTLTFLYDPELG